MGEGRGHLELRARELVPPPGQDTVLLTLDLCVLDEFPRSVGLPGARVPLLVVMRAGRYEAEVNYATRRRSLGAHSSALGGCGGPGCGVALASFRFDRNL